MAYEFMGVGAIDYRPCQYGSSKLIFRGPKKQLSKDYYAIIGGTETFGKFVEDPYPDLLEAQCDRTVFNLGCMYAGAEIFFADPTVLDICRKASATIIQLTGAQNMSNRFYSVHPRRNDRFVGATPLLHSIYKGLDFTNVHFTGHLLSMLSEVSVARFELVKNELQEEWVTKMQSILGKIGGRVILLWLSDHAPGSAPQYGSRFGEPMLLDRALINQLTGDDIELLEIVATPEEVSAGHDRMIFTPWEEAAALQMLGPIVHQSAALELKSRLAA